MFSLYFKLVIFYTIILVFYLLFKSKPLCRAKAYLHFCSLFSNLRFCLPFFSCYIFDVVGPSSRCNSFSFPHGSFPYHVNSFLFSTLLVFRIHYLFFLLRTCIRTVYKVKKQIFNLYET